MTEFERTTVRQSVDETVDPAVTRTTYPAAVEPPVTDTVGARRTVVSERSAAYVTGWATAARAVSLIFGILQALLLLRIVLLMLAAQQSNGIVNAILATTDLFVDPFRGMFRIDHIADSGSVLDVAAIVALIGWTLIEALIVSILRLANRRVAWQA